MMPASLVVMVVAVVFAAVLGLVMGSFVNCWAWRSTHGESIVEGRSHCPSCGHDLGAADLVPVFSWLASRGRCRHCGEKVSARYPLTEVVLAVAYVLILLRYGLTLETLELAAFASILLFLSLTDLDELVIPNGCIVAAIAVRAVYLAAMALLGTDMTGELVASITGGIALGAGVLVVVLVADRILGRESMGGGDLKLYAVAGFYFGWQQGLLLVLLSCVIGIVVAFAGLRDEQRRFPFGPSIAAACVVVMLVGEPLVGWYLGFF